eukprot:COSAG03_NODE_72_length_14536_cov_62.546336_3_plen_48_part_00
MSVLEYMQLVPEENWRWCRTSTSSSSASVGGRFSSDTISRPLKRTKF